MKSNEERIKNEKSTTLKEMIVAHKLDIRNFSIGTSLAAILSILITFSGIWQLIILPGIVAGFFNDKMKRGIFSGAIGVSTVWALYMLVAIVSVGAYLNVDQFAGLIFGSLGFGWVLILVVFLIGVLFGALGGAIGSGIKIMVNSYFQNDS